MLECNTTGKSASLHNVAMNYEPIRVDIVITHFK